MKLFTVRNAVLATVVALGLCVTAAHAAVTIPWSLLASDSFCPHRPGCHEQLHKVNLQAGTTYVITMRSTQLDSYLYLENSSGQVLAQDDDGGGNHDARIIYTPSSSGSYTVVATSFRPGETGNYTVTITP